MDANRWRLDGQLAVVTGGSAGIGLAIVRELLGFGARVLVVARDPAGLEQARADLADEFEDDADDERVFALAADVADDEQRREILDWIEDRGEGLNILVNNAGGTGAAMARSIRASSSACSAATTAGIRSSRGT